MPIAKATGMIINCQNYSFIVKLFENNVYSKILVVTIMIIFSISVIFSNHPYSFFDTTMFVYATTNPSTTNSVGKVIAPALNNNSFSNSSNLNTEIIKTMSDKDRPLLCGNNVTNSNSYVHEFITPILCSQPVGLTVDQENNIWIASGKSGTLLVFNTKTLQFDKTIRIPNWPEQTRNIGSMIWDLKFDKNGDLWFTDELSNSIWKYFVKEGKFENYRLLGEGGYPLSIAFDSDGNVWFTQVFGNRLGFFEPSKVINNTTEGISELDMSRQIDFQTMGPISNGFGFTNADTNSNTTNPTNANETLWFSTAIFPVGGHIIKYDIAAGSLTIHDVTHTHSVPFSIAEDESGTLWANSHIANLFFSLNPTTGEIKQYATSNPSASGNLTTLPYYNEYRDGKVWFNEHYGNAIASYDPKNKTLVEYYIPSQNPLWVNSSNPLRFIFDNIGSIWFTEWTENKLGVITKDRIDQIPIALGVSKSNITLDREGNRGDALDIYVYNTLSSNLSTSTSPLINEVELYSDISNNDTKLKESMNISMAATSSISKNGKLDNLTAQFSPESLIVSEPELSNTSSSPQTTSFKIEPTKEAIPGNYTLTISAKYNDDLTVSKIIDMFIK
jgi:virginiamycin B lyase